MKACLLILGALTMLFAGIVWWQWRGQEVSPGPASVPGSGVTTGSPAEAARASGNVSAVPANDHLASDGIGRTDAAGQPTPPRDVTATVTVQWSQPDRTAAAAAQHAVPTCEVDMLVTFPGAEARSRLEARTDANGAARFSIPGGEGAQVLATSPLGGRVNGRLRADVDNALTLELTPRLWLRGRVLDVADNPVVDADIDFVPFVVSEVRTSPRATIGRSGADGTFSIPLAGPGQVGASHPRFGPAEPHTILLPANAAAPESRDVTLHLVGSSAWVEGLVVDSTGQPVGGARVELRPAANGPRGPLALPTFATTGAGGRFTAGPLRPGPLAWSAIAAGLGPARGDFVAVADQRAQVRIELPLPCHLRGVVSSPTGQPIANAMVSAHCPGTFEPRRQRSAADGSFLFDTLAPGKVDCIAQHAGLRVTQAFTLGPDHDGVWNPVLGEGDGAERIAALLVDTSGALLAGWNVRLSWSGGRSVSARTDKNGEVDLPCLDPAPADAFVHAPGTALSDFADARFAALSPSRERVRLVVDTKTRRSTLQGRAESELLTEGRAEIALWHHEFREYASLMAGEGGAFRLDRVPPGTLDVVIRLRGHATMRLPDVAVRAGEVADLGTLTLRAAGAVRGDVVGPDGQPPGQLAICVITDEQRLIGDYSGGVYRVDDVPAGKHTLQVQGDGVAGASFPIEVTAGVEIEHRIELRAGVTRRIQIGVPPEARGYVSLSLRRAKEPMSWIAGQQVGSARTIEFVACMTPGDYEVTAWGIDGYRATGTVSFAPGDDSPLQFVLAKR